MADKRLILAVSAEQLPGYFGDTGFFQMTSEECLATLNQCDTWFGPRDVLEEFDAYRQIIPYILVTYNGAVVSYTRTGKGNETRLHSKMSIGLGGHVDLPDAKWDENGHFDLNETLYEGAKRELNEELGLEGPLPVRFMGLIGLNETEVDRVHLGIVGVVEITHQQLTQMKEGSDDGLGEVGLSMPHELKANADRLENWSKVLLPNLEHLV